MRSTHRKRERHTRPAASRAGKEQVPTLCKREARAFQDIYGEFDPGSGRTLAACLTHASRTGLSGSLLPESPSGARVSNTWAICPEDRDNSSKGLLIPDTPVLSHDGAGKEFIAFG